MKNDKTNSNNSGTDVNADRIYYLDWLRIITVLAVFFHHCSRLFDIRGEGMHNAVMSIPLTVHREFDNLWMMPLLFMISGASVFFSLKRRSAGGFFRERLLRILLPLLTVGIFVMAPVQVYLERLMTGEFSGNFFRWYPHYFEGDYPAGNFAVTGIHLWYLWFLLVYSIVLLPLFISFGKRGLSILSRFSGLFKKSWGLFLLFVPLIAIAPLEIYSNRLTGGWDFLPYLVFFICGYLFFSNELIKESVRKYCVASLATAVILTVVYLYVEFSAVNQEITSHMLTDFETIFSLSGKSFVTPGLTPAWAGFFVLRHLAAFFWMIALLGLGSRFVNFSNRFLKYANEAVLPFYILHLTIINIIAYYALRLNTHIAVKFVIIALSAFAAIMIIYELIVRRINILRLLFGMKWKKNVL